MYAYFGQNGSLLEIVFQGSANAGSSDYNKIFAFWDNDGWTDASSTYSATITFYDDEGSVLGTADLAMSVSSAKVPSTDDYDYTFFKENTFYKFATISVPAVVTAVNGWVRAVVRVFNGGTEVKALQDLTFQVNGSYVYDAVLTQSQYDYLMQLASSNQTEIGFLETYEELGVFNSLNQAVAAARAYFFSISVNVTKCWANISGYGNVYFHKGADNTFFDYRWHNGTSFTKAGIVFNKSSIASDIYTYALWEQGNAFSATNQFNGDVLFNAGAYFSGDTQFHYAVQFNSTAAFEGQTAFDARATFNDVLRAEGDIQMGWTKSILMAGGVIRNTGNKIWETGTSDLLKVTYTVPYYGSSYYGNTYQLITSDLLQAAKQEAITTAGTNADTKIDALKVELDFSNGAFGDIVADTLTVREFTADHTITIDSAIQSAFFEYLKGNTTSLGSNYAGSIFTKYDGTYDSFFGLHNDTIVFGDCNATRDSDGNVTGITPVSLIALAGRDDSANLIDGDLLMWDSTALKIVDAGLNPATMASDEQTRQENENTRQSNETKRQDFFEWSITKYPWGVTNADMVKLLNGGVFGVHFLSGSPVVTVYDNQAAAEGADEEYIFPMQSGVSYPALD